MKKNVLLAVCLGLALSIAASAQMTLTTTFASNNGQSGNMFDVQAIQNCTIVCFDVNLDPGTWTMEIWTLPGGESYTAAPTTMASWQLLGATEVTSNGTDVPTPLPLHVGVGLNTGERRAFYVTATNGTGINYTNGSTTGVLYRANAYLAFYEGAGKSYPFGATFSPRIWSGNIHFTPGYLETPPGLPGANGQNGAMFDVVASGGKPLTVLSFDTTWVTTSGSGPMEVYCVTGGGSYTGKQSDPTAWTLLGTGEVTANGPSIATSIPVPVGVTIGAGRTQGFYVTSSDPGRFVSYETHFGSEGDTVTMNADMSVLAGRGKAYPFGADYVPRNWKGHINYMVGFAPGGNVPEGLYYRFNVADFIGGTTPNEANPGLGTPTATVNGQTINNSGRIGGGLVGSGSPGNVDFVDTGWSADIGTSDWTLSFWLDLSGTAAVNPFGYLCGDAGAGLWRVFTNGAAGLGNTILRGPLTQAIITGGAPDSGNAHCAWVYDSSVPEIRGYLNGVLNVTVAQAAAVDITGGTGFAVGGYSGSTSSGLPAGGVMDEFRFYSRALTETEIFDGVNLTLGICGVPQRENFLNMTQSGPGVGDLVVSLTDITPGADEGFLTLTTVVSNPYGTGPFAGIYPDFYTFFLLNQPYFPGNPFHFSPNDPGVFPTVPFTLGPGEVSALAGSTFDYVALLFQGFNQVGTSNVYRIAFQ
ncbi:MAG: hypothetical protein CMJ83_08700 [Planctomycetes bacterium]|nr:hypothetical protein [Planctomycetota bacterium]